MVHTYPTKIVNSHGETMNTTYDYRFGKPLTVTDPTGSTMTYRYDFAGRLVTLNDLPNHRHVLELIVELMFYTMIAIRLAKEYNLDAEYIKCRKMGMSIADSLEEWDLLDMQKIHTMINQAQN